MDTELAVATEGKKECGMTDLADTEVVKTTVSLTKLSGVVPVTSSH